MINASRLLLVLALAAAAAARCFCPNECVSRHCDRGRHYDVRVCFDQEASRECEHANAEVTDMVNSMGGQATKMLELMVADGAITTTQFATLRAMLSRAFEIDPSDSVFWTRALDTHPDLIAKPVGDCSDAATSVRVRGTQSHCYSEPVLEQCGEVRRDANPYAAQIYKAFEVAVRMGTEDLEFEVMDPASGEMTAVEGRSAFDLGFEDDEGQLIAPVMEFIEFLAQRGSYTTANIRCSHYDTEVASLDSPATARSPVMLLVLGVAMALVL